MNRQIKFSPFALEILNQLLDTLDDKGWKVFLFSGLYHKKILRLYNFLFPKFSAGRLANDNMLYIILASCYWYSGFIGGSKYNNVKPILTAIPATGFTNEIKKEKI